ncbi:VlhA.4.07.5 variable lipoprotein family protein [Mycoplasmoides gallisepticum str. R(low)]|uniref:VlhA.4.06 variable lipoprotein family protein n=1 Tax=Mycoplasmoides gallisepticum (strain R(low / passage 15 / clone 2)) TaxID=710127 RepID=Q7NBR4_MYCGA|nr:FIVAR domain-containing protein [Mycoplasmoides gallisepticum]AAP56549.1 VlhA.4.06 variable lipoprotein family protein [Mycoplasmoides gallisepticum str. R(low)]ADB96864.1 VlhA.4.07.5 variable lipoprotein family protein [Mycoplasmoides gallisepticum str. R(low)]ADC30387.1 VlhA.4.06 variable lipoprotein family protein [Mycoplasmoides gallisepticum str. R(high)]ADC30394.1 VlhA.4.07.5 variable lipoprotein family protein [Mycoplasmoides gallisepticum str. R(high)]
MKRKNILKFVSLLGIGSFVMLAAASCTTPVNPTPNPTPTPNPEPNPTPNPEPKPNPPSGGMNGRDTNPGNGGGTDNAAQQLAAAKTALTTLLNTKSEKVGLYSDYAKIKDQLVKAYTAAKEISDKSDATLQEVNNAKTRLETAIKDAANSKTSFGEKNPELIKAYDALKQTITSEEMSLNQLMDANFETIKNHISNLYKQGKDIITATLDPTTGDGPQAMVVNQTNEAIVNATSKIEDWKTNATNLATRFVKQTLNNANLVNETNNQPQPGSYSFVAYSVDLNTGVSTASNTPNWNFAQRKVWVSGSGGRTSPFSSSDANNSPALTDVSWIYNLSGANSKYTLTFNWYGPSTGHLYFPYKLVKSDDAQNVGLQYTLNNKPAQRIEFAPAQSPSSGGTAHASDPQSPRAAATETDVSDSAEGSQAQTDMSSSSMNKTPTVSDINVASVTLSDLNFGANTIEFSVPMGDSMVAPMIGNMYITSNPLNVNQIYDDIFGNSLSNSTDQNKAVTVDLLKGYSLATNWSIYLARFTDLMEETQTTPNPVYLVGYIGGSQGRQFTQGLQVQNNLRSPLAQNDQRTFTIYVNAPEAGEYYISGKYLTSQQRGLKLSADNMNNSVTFTVQGKNNWTTLGSFDTSKTNATDGNDATVSGNKMTLTFKKGLNKIVVSSNTSNGETPYIGNLTFTLKSNEASSSSAESSK